VQIYLSISGGGKIEPRGSPFLLPPPTSPSLLPPQIYRVGGDLRVAHGIPIGGVQAFPDTPLDPPLLRMNG